MRNKMKNKMRNQNKKLKKDICHFKLIKKDQMQFFKVNFLEIIMDLLNLQIFLMKNLN